MPNFREGKLIYEMRFKFHSVGAWRKGRGRRILCPRSILYIYELEVLKGVC